MYILFLLILGKGVQKFKIVLPWCLAGKLKIGMPQVVSLKLLRFSVVSLLCYRCILRIFPLVGPSLRFQMKLSWEVMIFLLKITSSRQTKQMTMLTKVWIQSFIFLFYILFTWKLCCFFCFPHYPYYIKGRARWKYEARFPYFPRWLQCRGFQNFSFSSVNFKKP